MNAFIALAISIGIYLYFRKSFGNGELITFILLASCAVATFSMVDGKESENKRWMDSCEYIGHYKYVCDFSAEVARDESRNANEAYDYDWRHP